MFLNVVYLKGVVDISLGRRPAGSTSPPPAPARPSGRNPYDHRRRRPRGHPVPRALLQTQWFAILATFVAINTVMYAALAVAKILPKANPADWIRRRSERSETRSIDPDSPR